MSSVASIDPLGSVVDLANGWLSYQGAKEADDRNYRQNVRLWEMNNAYNTPANQMKRLEEAGLNPNLVYGGGSVSGNTSSQPSAPAVHPSSFHLNLAHAFMGKQFTKMNEEIKAIQEQNKIIKERYRALRYNNKLFQNAGLPTNASWWSPSLFSLMRDPERVNKLKGLGFNIGSYIGELLNPPAVDIDYDEPDLIGGSFKNGRVSVTHR